MGVRLRPRLGLGIVVVLLLVPTLVVAQVPPGLPEPDELRDYASGKLQDYQRNPVEAYEDVNGEQVDREDVRVALAMDFRTLDFDALGVVFGGGTFDAQARLTGRVEFRVLSVERVAQALKDAGLDPCGVGRCYNESFITADVFRDTLAGEALAAVEAAQERRVEQLIVRTFPNVTVVSTDFAWANVNPAINSQGDPSPTDADPEPDNVFYQRVGTQRLKEPPVVLDVVFDLQYVQSVSLLEVLRSAGEGEEPEKRGLLATSEGFLERNAFQQLGISQEIDIGVPPGWDIAVALRLPQGYTFEDASPEVVLDPSRQLAETYAFAGASDVGVVNPVAVSLTNRFLVTMLLLGATLVVGLAVRVPVALLATRWRHGRSA